MKNRLKEIRGRKGLTQEALADQANISRPTLAMIEVEKTVPDGDTIIKLVKALRLPAEEIFPELGVEEHFEAVEANKHQKKESWKMILNQVFGQLPRVVVDCQTESVIKIETCTVPRIIENEPQYFVEYWTLDGKMIGRFEKE